MKRFVCDFDMIPHASLEEVREQLENLEKNVFAYAKVLRRDGYKVPVMRKAAGKALDELAALVWHLWRVEGRVTARRLREVGSPGNPMVRTLYFVLDADMAESIQSGFLIVDPDGDPMTDQDLKRFRGRRVADKDGKRK